MGPGWALRGRGAQYPGLLRDRGLRWCCHRPAGLGGRLWLRNTQAHPLQVRGNPRGQRVEDQRRVGGRVVSSIRAGGNALTRCMSRETQGPDQHDDVKRFSARGPSTKPGRPLRRSAGRSPTSAPVHRRALDRGGDPWTLDPQTSLGAGMSSSEHGQVHGVRIRVAARTRAHCASGTSGTS